MPEFQLSSKYPDGTIAVAKGDDADEVIGTFLNFRKAYEEESKTAPIPVPPTHDEAVTTAQQGLGGQVQSDGPAPGLPSGSGDFHPTRKCEVCNAPLKFKVMTKKDSTRQYKKLECSTDFKHQNSNWWVGWVS